MIINYELAVSPIKAVIDGYDKAVGSTKVTPEGDNTPYKGSTVEGLNLALKILEGVKINSNYDYTLSGINKYDLRNIRDCIDSKIKKIEEGEKINLYRLFFDGITSYHSTIRSAQNELADKFKSLDVHHQVSDEFKVDINTVLVSESELPSYNVID